MDPWPSQAEGLLAPLEPPMPRPASSLFVDDWLAPSFNASELTDFPDAEVAGALALHSGRAMGTQGDGRRSPHYRSFSLNDLQSLQASGLYPHWAPQLPSVPEGAPSQGAPFMYPMSASMAQPVMSQPQLGASAHGMGVSMPIPMHRSHPCLAGPGTAGTSAGSSLSKSEEQSYMHRSPAGEHGFPAAGQGPGMPHSGSVASIPSHSSTNSLSSLVNNNLNIRREGSDGFLPLAAGRSALTQGLLQAFGTAPAPPVGFMHPSATYGGPMGPSGSHAHAHAQEEAAAGANAAGPLRKSQSAVELGSWRHGSGGAYHDLDVGMDTGAERKNSNVPVRLTPEERIQRILKYRAKRDRRNFQPKTTYVCRKTLADTRPRVGGRFARNEDPKAVLPHETKKAQRQRAASASAVAQAVQAPVPPAASAAAAPAAHAPALAGSTSMFAPPPMATPRQQQAAQQQQLQQLGQGGEAAPNYEYLESIAARLDSPLLDAFFDQVVQEGEGTVQL